MMRYCISIFVLLTLTEACHPEMKPVTTQAPTTTTTTQATTTTTQGPPCPEDWVESDRIAGTWCLKMVSLTESTYTAGQAACSAIGGVLSSIESPEELTLISSLRLNPSDYIILGAQLTTDCPCTEVLFCSAGACNLQNAFEWTDGFVTGRNLFDEASAGNYGNSLFLSPIDSFHAVQEAMMSATPSEAICAKQGN
ncbi:unnamed protein product [Caenorhabditis angaria]|uniref:C-type lectin domain-containing protein n=1 Tax=Caenorhabditis angaria TaxID=860376 RepID=A0A9P1N8L5_9PELO|nr:unnamed protein product [Caenorhabditis angaria]